MEPIFHLPIRLPPRCSRDLLGAVHRQLRGAILDGRLRPGLRLPATRALASTLGVSRNTIVASYDLLLSEGYLAARPGAGTYVASNLPRAIRPAAPARDSQVDRRLSPFWRRAPAAAQSTIGISYRFDFRLGLSDKAPFPFQIWRRLSARSLRALSKAPAAYAEPEGRPELRDAIAKHISFARAVGCRTDDVVVTSGAQQAFDLLARTLVTPGRTAVAIEDPGYPPLRAAFAAAGADISAVPVDGEGLMVHRLPAGTRVICVTPSHQFPLGTVMSLRRRAALLDFARANRAVVIEDDYDGEFRFGERPLDALQTLDRAGSVFYVGTFSKSLFPALRLGFVVAPPWARTALVRAKQLTDWHGAVLAQDTLAAFIVEGHLARHVRKMRRVYGDRRAALLEALARHCGDRLQPIPGEAGLHLATRLTAPLKAKALAATVADDGVNLLSLDQFAVQRHAQNGLAFGYGMIRAEQIDEAIRRLARAMRRERGA
jgi:GntR family transcriptional regulator/MocR family aminotransferase